MDRRTILSGAMCAAVGALSARSAAIPASRRPNLLLIYCDDLGFGDIGATGGREIPTPNLDALARDGLTLTDYYAPANVCTPSRAGLLTGRYPVRTGLPRVLLFKDHGGLPLSEKTIGDLLRPEYATALIGKWHLGHVAPYWPPTGHGFDLFYGIPYSHDMLPLSLFEYHGAEKVLEEPVDYYALQQEFCDRAKRFVADNRGRPFFLELALSAPHLPNFPARDLKGTSRKAGAYGDAVIEVDRIVGEMLSQLAELGLERDTLVIFTSDNGPWFEGSTGGLRQRKGGGAYDGGYRVPFIARWPGRIPPASQSDAIAMGIDLLPTFCRLAGRALPSGVQIDGKDISGLLLEGRASPHDELLLFQGDEVVGVRTQRWKYIEADFYMNNLMYLEGRGYPQLYDMHERGEQYSVASLYPEVVKEMRARLASAVREFAAYRDPGEPSLRDQASTGPPHHVPDEWQD